MNASDPNDVTLTVGADAAAPMPPEAQEAPKLWAVGEPRPVDGMPKQIDTRDSLGRTIRLRKLNALDKVDLCAILGAERSMNPAVAGPCSMAFSVVSIDGDPLYPATTYEELRAAILRLDDEGLEAIGDATVKTWMPEALDLTEAGQRAAVKPS